MLCDERSQVSVPSKLRAIGTSRRVAGVDVEGSFLWPQMGDHLGGVLGQSVESKAPSMDTARKDRLERVKAKASQVLDKSSKEKDSHDMSEPGAKEKRKKQNIGDGLRPITVSTNPYIAQFV